MKKSTMVLALLTTIIPLTLFAPRGGGGGGRSFGGGGGRGASFRGGGARSGRSMGGAGRSMRGAGARHVGGRTSRPGRGTGHVGTGGRGSHVGPGGRGGGRDGRGAGHPGQAPAQHGQGAQHQPGRGGQSGQHHDGHHDHHDHGHHDWNRGWSGGVVVGAPWYNNWRPLLVGAGLGLGYAGYMYPSYYSKYPDYYEPAPSANQQQTVNISTNGNGKERLEASEPKIDLLAAQRTREQGQPTGTASALAAQPVDVD